MVSSEIVNEGKSNKIFRKTRKKYPKWTKRVVKVRRITKVIKGGKKLRFGAVVVIGNGNGQVGLGVGKADDVIEAVKKAVNDGKRELISIPLTKNYSIPYVVTGKYGAANVIIKPLDFVNYYGVQLRLSWFGKDKVSLYVFLRDFITCHFEKNDFQSRKNQTINLESPSVAHSS